jgi:flagellar operon protein
MDVGRVGPVAGAPPAPAEGAARGPGFAAALQRALAAPPLRLSAHAAERLRRAGLTLGPEALQRVDAAVARAAARGGQNALVLMGSLALIVSVANRTVVTAVDGARMGQGVFTGIDSAVIDRGLDP